MKTALITGASSGIGKEFSQLFAKNGYNLVLVARSKDKLESIAEKLEKQYPVKVTVLTFDLSKQKSANELYLEIKNRKITINVLFNNAGFGAYGYFKAGDTEKYTKMLHLNIITVTELTSLFAKEMIERNEGKILNIASTAAFQPVPKFAVYAASKAYVLHFTEALTSELKGTNVTASVICPGPTATGFESVADMENSKLFKNGVMNPEEVARIGYNGLMRKKMTIIPGLKNKIMAFMSHMTPSRKLLVYVASKIS